MDLALLGADTSVDVPTYRWRWTSWLRARWWGLVVALVTDGLSSLTPDGRVLALADRPHLPEGPLVVVANHRSHADTAALLATLGRDRPVRFVAAADYWETSPPRRWAARALAGVWPVRRDGSGWQDLASAADAVRAGVVLVVYPEGTRSRDGSLGPFRTGAFRLAALAGARVLPIAVAGTDHVLPVHGRLRRGPIELRWAPPLDVPAGDAVGSAAEEARRRIATRLDRPVVARPRRVPAGLYGAKAWFTRRLAGLVAIAVRRRLSPDLFTAAGVVAAAVAGLAIALAWWPLAAVGLVGRLAGANLDGAVARARGVARPFGAVLNEVGDRASDLLVLAGLVALAWRTSGPGVAAVMALATVAATLPTFAALAVAAAGGPRANGGPFGKTERCLAALVGAVLGAVADRPAPALGALAGVIALGSVLTAALRLATGHRALHA